MKNTLEQWPRIAAEKATRNLRTGCVEWNMCIDAKGYGRVRMNGVWAHVHRVAYQSEYGEIPAGMHVLHKCDNRRCCNPAHLYAGTNAQNITDKMARDRSGKKITIAQAREIKDMVGAGHTQDYVASQFGIAQSNVSRIASGRRWAHAQTARV